MATFFYKAKATDKHLVSGTISASNRPEAADILVKRGLSPLVINERIEKAVTYGTIPEVDKITFCRYLSAMLSTGLSLNDGIEVLREETKHPLMRRILGDMSYSLEQGQQLSAVFERYPNVFERYFLVLTRVGEMSGKLADVFKYLETELRAEYSLKSKIRGALLYPGIVFSAMIGIGIMMFFFVLPQIGKVFLNLKLQLPAFTHFLFTFSIALSNQFIPIMISAALLMVGGVFALKKQQVRRFLMRFIYPIPLVRDLVKKIDLARFNRIFSTLLRSAVPITEALEISLESLSWYQYRELTKTLPKAIREGQTLAGAIKQRNVFPPLVVQMVAAGEKTGTLDSTLADLATFYEGEVEEELKNLTQIIEPLLMLVVGISVGAMILSIIAPIYSVVGSFQQTTGSPH